MNHNNTPSQHPQMYPLNDDGQQQQLNVKNEKSMGNIPVWTDDENNTLQRHMNQTNFLQDTDMIYRIKPFFPDKTVQQILNRIQWFSNRCTPSWEEFCMKQYSKPLPQPHAIYQQKFSPGQFHENYQDKQTLPSEPKYQQHTYPDQKFFLQQQFQNEQINQQPTQQQLSQQQLPQQQQLQQENPIQRETKPIPNQIGVQPIQESSISPKTNDSSRKRKPKSVKTEKEEVKQPKKQTRKRKNKEVEKPAPQNVNSSVIQNDIQKLVDENEQLLQQIQTTVDDQSTSLEKQWVVNFSNNIRNLLKMTDSLAKPARLPFLSLMLDLPPEMMCVTELISPTNSTPQMTSYPPPTTHASTSGVGQPPYQ
ncbi:Myb-like domain-containing protein [Entamoeba marina]